MAVVNSTILDNVKVSIVSDTFDEELGMNITDATGTDKYSMLYVDTFFVQDGTRQSLHERDIPSRYRFVYRPHNVSTNPIVTGMMIKITHTRHPITKGWVVTPTQEVYVVKFVGESSPNTGIFDIGASLRGEE